jgi:UDP-N-acetylglucosamine 2-epimerase (non-hydrolysing)
MKIDLIVGARPNFMKVAPLYKEIKNNSNIDVRIVHTGQHYDKNMSDIFFEELEIPKPDINLGVGSGSHGWQTGKIMMDYEEVIKDNQPDIVFVVGDVNSTVAVALVAKKSGITLCHIEAGLRSFDKSMPEEINRMVTDSISDHLFTTSKDANNNLRKEGHSPNKIHFVGNLMIDSLNSFIHKSKSEEILKELNLKAKRYALVTLHRPSNVDNPEMLKKLSNMLNKIQEDTPIIFPAHPRIKNKLDQFKGNNLHIRDPLGYLEFIGLEKDAKLIITDSGGIQEETTFLGVPCVTLRENTERPVTIDQGTNILLKPSENNLADKIIDIINNGKKEYSIPEKWDGKTAERILKIIKDIENNKIN